MQRSSSTVITATRESLSPDVISSFVLAALVLTCRCVIKIAVLNSANIVGHCSSSFFHFQYSSFESLANSAAMLAFVWLRTPAGNGGKNACVLTVGVSLISAVVVELTGFSSLPPVPFQVFLAVPLCFLGVTFSLWRGLYGHLCSMLGHLLDWWCVDRPSQASGVGPVYIASQTLYY